MSGAAEVPVAPPPDVPEPRSDPGRQPTEASGRTPDRGETFRPDLEGLRAVAVVLVLLYHARVPRFGGGYVGVDVFFVLSGFLITGLLLRELSSTGRVSLPAFYARRARRLLPAAALVLLVTAVASALLLPPLRMPDVSADIAAAAAYASNIRFALQATDYLASDLPPSPVLHYWSLGVEEQFYLFWPALLVVAAGAAFAVGNLAAGIRRVSWTLVVVFIASLALSIWLTEVQQPWAFFSLPTRAWELALGGLLAVPAATRLAAARGVPLLGWAGLVMIAASGFVLDDATAFPGVAALLPTVGCALVVFGGLGSVGGTATARRGLTSPGPLLSLPPVRYLGRISYSLYLWHWPVLVLPVAALGALPGVVRLGLAGLAIALAAASQRWVEEPIRHGRIVGVRPRRVLALAGALTLTVALSATWLGSRSASALQAHGPAAGGGVDEVNLPPLASPGSTGGPRTSSAPGSSPAALPSLAAVPVPADLVPTLATARSDNPVIYADGCHVGPAERAPADGCVFGDPTSATTVVLFGDSHAGQWFPALDRLAQEHGWRLLSMTKSACASADVPVWSSIFDRPYAECMTWREQVLRDVATLRPALVVIANDRAVTLAIDGQPASTADHPDVWPAGLAATIQRIRSAGSQVVVIGDTVRQTNDPPVCLSAHLDDASACATPYAQAVDRAHLDEERAVAAAQGVPFIDPTPLECFTDPCPTVIGRFLVYRDTHHMTATYARALAPRLFTLLPAVP
jgi:peptidoglycan/LPS O-acetylase OafA/YrhL